VGVIREGTPDAGDGREGKGGGTGEGIYNIGIRQGWEYLKRQSPALPFTDLKGQVRQGGVCSLGILAGSPLHTYKSTLSLAYE